jgi:hypothetical protein
MCGLPHRSKLSLYSMTKPAATVEVAVPMHPRTGIVCHSSMGEISMDFFCSKGTPISGRDWLNCFVETYFLAGKNIEQRINCKPVRNRTSRFVEDQLIALLQNGQLLTANDLKLIMAWKMGEIYQVRSEEERRIIYRHDWDKNLVCKRFRRDYGPSINWLSDNMGLILNLMRNENPEAAFNLIRNEHLFGFGQTSLLSG